MRLSFGAFSWRRNILVEKNRGLSKHRINIFHLVRFWKRFICSVSQVSYKEVLDIFWWQELENSFGDYLEGHYKRQKLFDHLNSYQTLNIPIVSHNQHIYIMQNFSTKAYKALELYQGRTSKADHQNTDDFLENTISTVKAGINTKEKHENEDEFETGVESVEFLLQEGDEGKSDEGSRKKSKKSGKKKTEKDGLEKEKINLRNAEKISANPSPAKNAENLEPVKIMVGLL